MLKAVFFDMGGTIDTFRYTREQRIKAVSSVRECLSRTGIITTCSDTCLADMITAGTSEYLRWNMVTNVELKPAEIWATFFLKDLHLNPADLEPVAEELAQSGLNLPSGPGLSEADIDVVCNAVKSFFRETSLNAVGPQLTQLNSR